MYQKDRPKEINPPSELLRLLFPQEEFTAIMKKKQPFFKGGTYLFNAKLELSYWRTLQLSSDHTLLDLHGLIQDAFDFDIQVLKIIKEEELSEPQILEVFGEDPEQYNRW